MKGYEDILEERWLQHYKDAGFSRGDIKFYEETPIGERAKNYKWRSFDNRLSMAIKRSIQPGTPKYNTGFVSDCIELKSMSDGKMYDSRARYYDSLKRNDSHIIEKGEHEQNLKKMGEVKGDFNCRKELKQAIEQHLH